MIVGRAHLAFLLFLGIFAASFPPPACSGFFEQLLPAWPLVNVGDPIPESVVSAWRAAADKCPGIKGEFSAFPSKGNRGPNDKDAKSVSDPLDPGAICDDGEQTIYNGLLCASGEAAGCVAVAEAQDGTGRWFRSPHRRWMWAHRCLDKKHPLDAKRFHDDCTYGFSPDMILGVVLYTLKTHDQRRYDSWLKWLDSTAATTKLCKLDGSQVVDCIGAEWPRVCTEDPGRMGPGEDPGFAINGRYGGKCALRPWDALDLAAVQEATAAARPSRISKWDAQARALIKASKDIMSAAVAGPSTAEIPALVIMSSVDGKKYSAHLDAIRVLVRMMIRNPSLKLETLSPVPDPDDALPGVLSLAASDLTDPVSIKLAAETIAARVPWDPFYQLLSEGPSPRVRSMIIDHCPKPGDKPSKRKWIWEEDADVGASQSMGWDCVFVGNLYNTMRVKTPLADELFALFRNYADGLSASLTQALHALELAEAANLAAKQAVIEAEQDLSATQDFVNAEQAQLRESALNDVHMLTNQLAQLKGQEAALERRLADLGKEALTLPDTAQQQTMTQTCKWVPWPKSKLCENVTSTVHVANPAKRKMLDDIASVEKAIEDLKNGPIASTQDSIAATNDVIANLDSRLQAARAKLQRRTLQTEVDFARTELRLKAKLLDDARSRIADVRRADARVKGYLCVWNNEAKCAF